jgi:hypothetical protein
MELNIAAMRIGREINASEDALDAMIAQLGKLVSEIATARVATGTAAITAHRAIARASAAQAKLVEARMDLVRSHEDLRRIAEAADMPNDCPPTALQDETLKVA